MFRSFRSKCGILSSYSITLKYFKVLIYFIHDSITLTSSEYDISSDGALWKMRITLSELFSTSFRSGHLGYVKRAHFIHDSITLTSSEFDVSSDGLLS
ncbi:hypothetical protein T12_2297 [Trichinella patagoniensis]|uniref:Uncharacterized protein n=1 Tax=Trichinella patagoniensis TaxID=990121 RepID=A0A0V0YZJ6_9BILA|nr:hypothetical protein T12_2297 [Trichinella patagoniensis]